MLRSFIIKLTVFTIGLSVLILLLNSFSAFFYSIRSFTWMSLAFFFPLTILTGYIGFRSLDKTPHGFIASVNGIVMIKLLMCIGFVLGYLLIAKPGVSYFIISFFAMYILYSIFEIREFIIAQRRKIQQEKISKHGNG
jgi:hypothetical protein